MKQTSCFCENLTFSLIQTTHDGKEYSGPALDKDRKPRWSTLHKKWIYVPGNVNCGSGNRGFHGAYSSKPEDDPNGPDVKTGFILLCPFIFENWKYDQQLSYYKTHQYLLQGKQLDDVSSTPAKTLFHELTHTKMGGYGRSISFWFLICRFLSPQS